VQYSIRYLGAREWRNTFSLSDVNVFKNNANFVAHTNDFVSVDVLATSEPESSEKQGFIFYMCHLFVFYLTTLFSNSDHIALNERVTSE
jgi:hypothetical protein